MKAKKLVLTYSVILSIIFGLLLIFMVKYCYFVPPNNCNNWTYAPDGPINRFISIVLNAQSKNDESVIHETVSEEAYESLREFPLLTDIGYSITEIDFLESKYNHIITFDGGQYFYFWLEENDASDLCEDMNITDDKLISRFELLRISSLYLPDDVIIKFMDIVFIAAKEKNDDLLRGIATDDVIIALGNIMPNFKEVHSVSGLKHDTEYNYRLGINKDRQYIDVLLDDDKKFPMDTDFNQISDQELIHSMRILMVSDVQPKVLPDK